MATYQNGNIPSENARKNSASEKNDEFAGVESLSHVAAYRAQPLSSPQVIAVPTSVSSGLGSPTALGIGAFATTLTTLSLALMEWRGVDVKNVFIANFFFLAAVGMVITAQWELVKGNGYGYVVLSAFGLFYGGYGAIITPAFGVEASFGGDIVKYYNAFGFFMIIWTVLNLFFTLESLTINIAYAGVFVFVELGFLFVAAAYFALADGHAYSGMVLQKVGGACCFISGMFAWYTMGHLMCQKVLFFSFPLGDTSRFFEKQRRD